MADFQLQEYIQEQTAIYARFMWESQGPWTSCYNYHSGILFISKDCKNTTNTREYKILKLQFVSK